MVLVQPGGNQRVKKIVQEPKWIRSSPSMIVLESQDGNKVTLHQKRVRQRRESNRYLQDTLLTSEMLQMTAWPSSLSPEPSTYMPHVVTLDIRLIFPDILLRKAYSAHAYS